MILHVRRDCVEAIGIMEHSDIMIDSSRYPWVRCISRLLFAEMSDDHWELVVFGEMTELHIVIRMSDVEDYEDTGAPLLNSDEPSLSRHCGISHECILP